MMTRFLSAGPGARRNRGIGRRAFVGFLLLFFILPTAAPAGNAGLNRSKNSWQTQYRELLTRADQLREKIELETGLYADANRRNYRRGKKRHVHRKAIVEAKAELAEVEARLETIVEDGRRAGALPGWFYEVENEREDAGDGPPTPASPDNEGRNPIYAE